MQLLILSEEVLYLCILFGVFLLVSLVKEKKGDAPGSVKTSGHCARPVEGNKKKHNRASGNCRVG